VEHDPGTEEALRVVQDVAGEALAAGRATITVERSPAAGGWLINLIPGDPRACAVSLMADYPPTIDMFLGPEPTSASYEFWQEDRPENLALLRKLLTAVVAGRYEQHVKTFKRNHIKVIGRFELPDGERSHEVATTASAAVKAGEEYTLRFEPY
jgi:hypothetical protein